MASGLFETFYTSLGLGLQFLGSYCFLTYCYVHNNLLKL